MACCEQQAFTPLPSPTTAPDFEKFEMNSPRIVQSPEPTEEQSPLRIFVFDTQRTSSQLFNRQLLSHLRFGSISNPYALAATLGPERIQCKLQNNEKAKQAWEDQVASAPKKISSLTYQDATVKFLTEADRLEQQGKILFVREQSPLVMKHDIVLSAIHSRETVVSKLTNPTCIPDELLKVVTPIIFIRHPARVIPAWLREANSPNPCYTVDDDDLTLWTSARWSRIIFDYLRGTGYYKASGSRPPLSREDSGVSRPPLSRENSAFSRPTLSRENSSLSVRRAELPVVASRPMVIDAADAMHNTHAILSTVCRILGLDAEEVQGTWSMGTKFERACGLVRKTISENLLKAFSERLQNTDKKTMQSEYNIDLDVEQTAWTKEFGSEVAQALRRKVEDELPHYNYLKSFKLCVRPSITEISFNQNIFGVPLEPRWSMDGSVNSIWMEGEKSSGNLMTEIRRASSLGQVPAGIMS